MKTKSAHTILTDNNGSILLTQRNDVPIWVIPGGTVEDEESPTNCVIREIKEELGVDINNPKLIAKYSYKNKSYAKELFMCVVNKSITKDIKPSDEVRAYRWFKTNKLPQLISIHEIDKVKDYISYNNKLIEKDVFIDKKKELLHLLQNPFNFAYILFSFTKNRLNGGKFKV